jgi:hypothetical protein
MLDTTKNRVVEDRVAIFSNRVRKLMPGGRMLDLNGEVQGMATIR